jgi:hypothetical protein
LKEDKSNYYSNKTTIHYFKPSFIGGFKGTQEWIDLAERSNNQIGWWITALESNIG